MTVEIYRGWDAQPGNLLATGVVDDTTGGVVASALGSVTIAKDATINYSPGTVVDSNVTTDTQYDVNWSGATYRLTATPADRFCYFRSWKWYYDLREQQTYNYIVQPEGITPPAPSDETVREGPQSGFDNPQPGFFDQSRVSQRFVDVACVADGVFIGDGVCAVHVQRYNRRRTELQEEYYYYDRLFLRNYTIQVFFDQRVASGMLIRNGAGTGLLRGNVTARPLADH